MAERDDPLLSQREAARYLSISRRSLQRLRAEGKGPEGFRLPSGYWRYRRSALDRWLREQGDRPPAPPGE